eukprot:m.39688 g.39688  ORF g.39688 m.39688 type:complete len:145 (-) comp11300_c0_seq1:50-484(-)
MGDGGVTEEEISKFREAFFGKNGPGHVTLAQLRELATAIGEPDIPDTTLQSILKKAGKPVDFGKMLELLADAVPRPQSEADMATAFAAFDTDRSGTITIDELRAVLKGLDHKMSASDLESLVKDIDADGDGQISYKEFAAHMMA